MEPVAVVIGVLIIVIGFIALAAGEKRTQQPNAASSRNAPRRQTRERVVRTRSDRRAKQYRINEYGEIFED